VSRRLTLAALTVLLAACGGSSGLSEAERTYCLTKVSPLQMTTTADSMGIDMTAAFNAASDAMDEASDSGKTQAEVFEAAQAALESHPDYITVCQSMYQDR
jgi:hypothetical protein